MPETVTPDLFRAAMRRFAGACNIITTAAPGEGRAGWAGMVATAVVSVTAEPAQVLVCVNRSTWSHGVISRSGVLGVNVLGDDNYAMAQRFAGGVPPIEKFDEGDWTVNATGAPLLSEALVGLDCRVVECIAASTHDLFLCDIVGVNLRDQAAGPLIYFDGSFMSQFQPSPTTTKGTSQ